MKYILVIDDDEQVLRMTKRMLERAGYSVATARNGKDGLQLQRDQPSGLVITDIFMPEKEGLETIQELRKDFPHVKIIAVSGGGRKGLLSFLSFAERFGAHRTITKPFETSELIEAVRQLLGEPEREE